MFNRNSDQICSGAAYQRHREKRKVTWHSADTGTQLSNENLIQLLSVFRTEAAKHADRFVQLFQFFVTTAWAILAVTIVGLSQLSDPWMILLLLFGPVASTILVWLGHSTATAQYRRLLEDIVLSMKIQHLMGLDRPVQNRASDELWIDDEYLDIRRHIDHSRKYRTSEDFISEHLSIGVQIPITRTKWLFTILGLFLSIAIVMRFATLL
jgi:hypothetical protein